MGVLVVRRFISLASQQRTIASLIPRVFKKVTLHTGIFSPLKTRLYSFESPFLDLASLWVVLRLFVGTMCIKDFTNSFFSSQSSRQKWVKIASLSVSVNFEQYRAVLLAHISELQIRPSFLSDFGTSCMYLVLSASVCVRKP